MHKNEWKMIVLLWLFSVFHLQAVEPVFDERSYVKSIQAIYGRVVDLTSELDLKKDAQFAEISKQPDRYGSYALQALGDEGLSEDEKMVVLLSMSHLDEEKYQIFLNDVYDLFETRKVTRRILIRTILPGDDWSRAIVDHYKDPSLVTLLEKIKQSSHLEKGTSDC